MGLGHLMKTLLLATAACALVAGSAAAADWNGFYAGANLGYAGDEFNYPLGAHFGSTTVNGQADLTSSGFIGGLQGGYNWRLDDRWVLGVEADINASDVTGELGVSGGVTGGATASLSASVGSEIDNFSTLRVRLGYRHNDNLLPYVTAGAAFGDVSTGYAINVSSGGSSVFSASGSKSSDQSGWTAGVGVEYRVGDKFSMKTEYLYADLGDYNVLNASLLGGAVAIDAETTLHTVRFGVNYLFD